MYVRTRWRVVVCELCRLPVEAVITCSPYIPIRSLHAMAEDHRRAYGHWPNTRVTDAELEG